MVYVLIRWGEWTAFEGIITCGPEAYKMRTR